VPYTFQFFDMFFDMIFGMPYISWFYDTPYRMLFYTPYACQFYEMLFGMPYISWFYDTPFGMPFGMLSCFGFFLAYTLCLSIESINFLNSRSYFYLHMKGL
jgi:hypothetical protein